MKYTPSTRKPLGGMSCAAAKMTNKRTKSLREIEKSRKGEMTDSEFKEAVHKEWMRICYPDRIRAKKYSV